MSNRDFDSGEREFQREIAGLAAGVKPGSCPKPDALMAAMSGVEFEGAEALQRHAADCPVCRQLSRDLAEYEFPPVSDAEDRRIRARWRSADGPPARALFNWRFLSFAATAAAAVAIAVLILRHPAPPPEPAREARNTPPAAAPVTSVFALTKAAIKIPAAAVLTFRGDGGSSQQYLTDLAAALEPYRKDDIATAADKLTALQPKYPSAAEPSFYLGVCQLLLNRNQAARESLESARRHDAGELRDDIAWYLAIAFERTGRLADSRSEAERLCRQPGEYKAPACAAAAAMSGR